MRYSSSKSRAISPDLAGNIRKAIDATAKTQRTIARKARISEMYLSELASGAKKNPTIGVLEKLAKALDTRLAELVK